MRLSQILALRLRSLFRRGRVEGDLDEELRFHLEQQIASNLASGMTPAEARYAALRSFGGVEQMKEECRDARALGWLEDFARNLRFAARSLRNSPGFAAVAVLTLAIGIGATTAVLAVMNAVLLPRLPYPAPGRIMDVYSRSQKVAWDYAEFVPVAAWREWRAQNHTFDDIAAFTWAERLNLSGAGEAARVRASRVSPNIFSVLGIAPSLGRGFTDAESGRVAVLSYPLWKRTFDGRSDVVGRTIQLDRASYIIIGVLPQGFQLSALTDRFDLLLPLEVSGADAIRRDIRSVIAVGRLRNGVSQQAAQADLSAIAREQARLYPATDAGWDTNVIPLTTDLLPFARTRLTVFLGLAALLLLIACLNVAVLLLARGESRKQQTLVRIALGARRRQLAGSVIAESLLIGALGSALAIALASQATHLLLAYMPSEFLNHVAAAPLDLRVLGAAILLALVATALVAILPALLLSRGNLNEMLGHASARLASGQRWRLPLVGGEIAVGLALTVCAGLLVRSLDAVGKVDLGFDPHNVVSAQVALDPVAYASPASRVAFFDRLLESLRARPGLEVAAGSSLPIGGSWVGNMVSVPGQKDPDGDLPYCLSALVYPDYFRTLRMPLLAGRSFSDADSDPVAVINETMAKKFFPGRDPVGQMLIFRPNQNLAYNGATPGPRRVIGVARDTQANTVLYNSKSSCVAFFPYRQNAAASMAVIVRSPDPEAAIPALRAAVAQLDPAEPLYNVSLMDDEVDRAFGSWRFQSWFASLAAAVSLLLAALGVYGIVSHSVQRRTHEIAIRMALGGQPAHEVRRMAWQAAGAVAAGIVGGVLLATSFTHALASMLFEVKPFDVFSFVEGALVLAAAAAIASYLPARRVTRVDPLIALRHE